MVTVVVDCVVGVHLPSEQSSVVLAGAVRLGGRVVTWPVEREATVFGPRDGGGVRGPALTPSLSRGGFVGAADAVACCGLVVTLGAVRGTALEVMFLVVGVNPVLLVSTSTTSGRVVPLGPRLGGFGFVTIGVALVVLGAARVIPEISVATVVVPLDTVVFAVAGVSVVDGDGSAVAVVTPNSTSTVGVALVVLGAVWVISEISVATVVMLGTVVFAVASISEASSFRITGVVSFAAVVVEPDFTTVVVRAVVR